MKIVLISSPTSLNQRPDFPPAGISYLGAVASDHGHEVLLIDGGLHNISDIVKTVQKIKPQFVGVTCWTIDRKMVWNLCTEFKQVSPNSLLVIGGPHATMYPEHIFKKTHAFAVVLGEGEETFPELLDAIEHGKDLKKVSGIALRNQDGTAYYTDARSPIENIDSIQLPYYSGFERFNFNLYGGFPPLPRPTAAIISSRGCVFECSYCSSVRFWGKRWRFRSAENVLSEMKWLVDKWGVKSFYFFDDNFPVNRERVISICQGIIDNKWNITWACCSHVKMITREMLKVMHDSGCVTIDFGVESGSDKILNNINKRQTRKDIEKAFKLVHESGIIPRAYLMVGNPGEDISTINETIDLIDCIKPRSSIGATILWLLPGTTLYEDAVHRGYISDDYWLNNDDIPYNQQDYTLEELKTFRKHLMFGIARKKGGISPMLNYYLKNAYYEYPFLSRLRRFVPSHFR